MDIDIHSLLFCVNKTLYERKFVVSVSNYLLTMNCNYCQKNCIKKGKQKNGTQKFFCCSCKKYQQMNYQRQAFRPDIDKQIITLVKESCGIRSISRILNISPTTVISRTLKISAGLKRPYPIVKGNCYEVDELFTYVGQKRNRICICYSLEPKSGAIIDVVVGRRNKTTLRKVTDALVLSDAKCITTDKLNIYNELIPAETHSTKLRGINHIERKNLSLRTHLKRLGRKSICYCKSLAMLLAVVRIYFWC